MQNRAKCKLCKKVIESYHSTDYVQCDCGEISVSEGMAMNCGARDYANFLRVDDEGNEIVVTIKDKGEESLYIDTMSKDLDMLIDTMGDLPIEAMSTPLTHYDYLTFLKMMRDMVKGFKGK